MPPYAATTTKVAMMRMAGLPHNQLFTYATKLIAPAAENEATAKQILSGKTRHSFVPAGLNTEMTVLVEGEPINLAAGASAVDASVLASVGVFSQLNYFAFICLTTVGFGDIQPMLPRARVLSVSTGIAGPIYLAVVMGVLIGRYAATVERQERDPTPRDPSR